MDTEAFEKMVEQLNMEMKQPIYETQLKEFGAQALDVRHSFIGEKSIHMPVTK